MGIQVQRNGEIISLKERTLISNRYHTITKAVNSEFWNSTSEVSNSIYVGSYGRGTAISSSDIDVLIVLPSNEFDRFDSLLGNSQSRLLQAVRRAVLEIYPRTEIRADGQVVKILFTDGMKFEILPSFKNLDWAGKWNGTYTYADSNNGGMWCSTNPKAEQEAMYNKNRSSNGLLFDTCKHMRFLRDNYFTSYHLSGIVIDSFVYAAMENWRWLNQGESSASASGTYENVLLSFLDRNSYWGNLTLSAPGSGDNLSTTDSFECLKKVIHKMAD